MHQNQYRTSFSFTISLILHLCVTLYVLISFPVWHRQIPVAEPIIMNAISVNLRYNRFHITAPSKKQRLTSSSVKLQTSKRKSIANRQSRKKLSIKPIRAQKDIIPTHVSPLHTKANLMLATDSALTATENQSETQIGISKKVIIEAKPVEGKEVRIQRGMFQLQQTDTTEEKQDNSREKTSTLQQTIEKAIKTIASSIADGTDTSPIDIVFLLDASGSMEDNIQAVGNHLKDMVKIFQEHEIDFTMGVVKFKYTALIFEQTKDYKKFERLLQNIECGGSERALHAIVKSSQRVNFRSNVRRRFILVTDESFEGDQSYKITQVIAYSQQAGITVDVIGIQDQFHKYLARQTGGLWFPIP